MKMSSTYRASSEAKTASNRRPPAGACGSASVLRGRLAPELAPWFTVGALSGVPVIEARLPAPFRVVFTTRLGGDSHGKFASFNLDDRSGLDPMASGNRTLLSQAIGRQLVSPAQVHGLRVVGTAEYAAGSPDEPCDGLTLHPLLDQGLAPLLLFADCLPIVLYGEADLAVIHGGWRGLLGGIVQRAGSAMMSAPGGMIVGPSIGPCCFTVAQTVAEAFARRYGEAVIRSFADQVLGVVYRVDLWAAGEAAASEIGIPSSRVRNLRLCTACNRDLFYSYRAEGPLTGRHGCLAWAEGQA